MLKQQRNLFKVERKINPHFVVEKILFAINSIRRPELHLLQTGNTQPLADNPFGMLFPNLHKTNR